jgi:hypothetical protein
MTITRLASLRPAGAAGLALAAAVALAGCATDDPTPSASSSSLASSAAPSPSVGPTPEPTPSPTPDPTPRFTNEPDDELAGLIPTDVNGVPVIVAPFEEFALTPGDIGVAYGDIGDRFASLALAYVEQPRLTLYAMRVDGEPVTTDDLEPHLATAGRYVGIAGLDPEPWEAGEAGGHRVWVRPEDNATAAGTMIYTWSSGEFVFLLIGVDDTVNRGVIAALPGEPAPSPTPIPTTRASSEPAPSASEAP